MQVRELQSVLSKQGPPWIPHRSPHHCPFLSSLETREPVPPQALQPVFSLPMCWGMGSPKPCLRKPKPKWCMYKCTGTSNKNRKKIQKVEELLQKNTCIVPDYFLNQVVKVGRRYWVCLLWFQLHVVEVTCKFWAIAWSSGCVDAYPGRTSCRTHSMSETPKSGTGPNRLWIRSWPSWKDSIRLLLLWIRAEKGW